MKDIEGDLLLLALAGHFDVIVHGCNCQCTMGAGVAKAIKLQNALTGMPIPLHPGAERYFREAGVLK